MERKFIIYKITNLINSKIYIEQTTQTFEDRISEHQCGIQYVDRAIKKYGIESFNYEKVEECNTIEELNEREKYWIAYYDCISPKGYNLTSGGRDGYVASEETKEKRSKSTKGKKIITKEQRVQISETLKKYFSNPEARAKLSESKKKNMSDETRKKISEAAKRRAQTPEGKAHLLAASQKAAKLAPKREYQKKSEETKRKLSLSRKDKKRVRCIETGEEFESLAAAGKKYNVYPTTISKACKKLLKTVVGKHWEFIDYEIKTNPIVKNGNLVRRKSVRCIETGEIFESIGMAARKYKTITSNISSVCRGVNKTASGKHWEFVNDEFKNIEIVKNGNLLRSKKIRCIETGKTFESIGAAARKYEIPGDYISKILRGFGKTAAGKHWELVDKS